MPNSSSVNEFLSIGTAVVRFRTGGPPLRPRLVLGLDD